MAPVKHRETPAPVSGESNVLLSSLNGHRDYVLGILDCLDARRPTRRQHGRLAASIHAVTVGDDILAGHGVRARSAITVSIGLAQLRLGDTRPAPAVHAHPAHHLAASLDQRSRAVRTPRRN